MLTNKQVQLGPYIINWTHVWPSVDGISNAPLVGKLWSALNIGLNTWVDLVKLITKALMHVMVVRFILAGNNARMIHLGDFNSCSAWNIPKLMGILPYVTPSSYFFKKRIFFRATKQNLVWFVSYRSHKEIIVSSQNLDRICQCDIMT